MKTKKVNRYYCDFCDKSGCAKGHMARHEKHCMMNPDRKCRMCEIMGVNQKNMNELLKLVEPYLFFDPSIESDKPNNITEEGLSKLHEATEGCPACILATLRQAKLDLVLVNFNYKHEVNEFWGAVNEKYTLENVW